MRHRWMIFCCLFASLACFSQDNADIKKGDACMSTGAYTRAIEFYQKAAKEIPNQANEKLAKAYEAAGDFQNAEKTYSQWVAATPDTALNRFCYAQVLRRNGKYSEAGKAYQTYFGAHPSDPLAGEFRDFDTRVRFLLVDNKDYKLVNIPENTAGSEEGPSFCVYFLCFASSERKGEKENYDLYMAHGGNPSNPAAPEKLKGDINGNLNEGPATFSRNGREMICTRSNYGHKGADGIMRLGLYHADYDTAAKKWGNIKPLNFIDYNYNFKQPSLSGDGSTLYFASDMKGGLGGTDIYVCHRLGEFWSTPVNLGSGINTTGNDETPFIADDGVLYFASDSRMGLGGMDIYSATQKDGVWGHASNMGAPLNSAYDDFGYISDAQGASGYFVSNRPGGKGGNDIYRFVLTKH